MRPEGARSVFPKEEIASAQDVTAKTTAVHPTEGAAEMALEASRERAAALPSFEERLHKARVAQEPYKLVVLQRNGMPALELTMRPAVARTLALFTVLLALGSGATLGFQARPMLARGVLSPIAASMLGSVLPIDEAQGDVDAGDEHIIDGGEPKALAHQLGLGTRKAASLLLGGRPRPEWVNAANEVTAMPTSLAWPVKHGGYVRGFGSGMDGYHLAVDVSGKRGTDVVASAGGIVGYAGDGIRGYGNTVILIHPGGWITMYAHNETNLVVAGEQVMAKQTIAKLGNSGISRGPHVHYEFMYAGNNCDPAPLFRPGVMHLNGKVWDDRQVDWKPTDKRPRDVRCSPRRRHPLSRWVQHEADGDLASPQAKHADKYATASTVLRDHAEQPEAVTRAPNERRPEPSPRPAMAQPAASTLNGSGALAPKRRLEHQDVGGGPMDAPSRSAEESESAAQDEENAAPAAAAVTGRTRAPGSPTNANKAPRVETTPEAPSAANHVTGHDDEADSTDDEPEAEHAPKEPAPAQVTETAATRAKEPAAVADEPTSPAAKTRAPSEASSVEPAPSSAPQ